MTATARAQCELDTLAAADAAAGDQFGYAVDLSGDLCVVGARFDDGVGPNSGAAYVFRFDPDSDAWIQQAKLTAADAAAADEFGNSVSAHSFGQPGGVGDVVLIGSRYNDDAGSESGSAYVYRYDGVSWSQQAKLTASDATAGDRFGFAVSIAGDFALISARDDDSPLSNCGSAYAFHYNGTNWVQQAKLTASDKAANDQLGQDLSIALTTTGAVAVIGSWHDDDAGSNSGSAYIFRYTAPPGNGWAQGAKLVASDAAAGDVFGFSVSITAPPGNNEVVLIGARSDDNPAVDSGSAYVFEHVGTPWIQDAKLSPSPATASDEFGYDVSLSSDGLTALVSAWHNDDAGADSGCVYSFRPSPGGAGWSQVAKLIASDAAASDSFGSSVAISGDQAVIGALQNDDAGADSGSAYLYAGVTTIDDNGNGIADGCDADGDVDGDGAVDFLDIVAIIMAWGPCPTDGSPCPADLNHSGAVDIDDLLIVIMGWQ